MIVFGSGPQARGCSSLRSSGATAAPKYDPIYTILNTANVWSGWGDVDDEWSTSLRYDPLAQLFAAATTAPTVRSKYDVLQVCLQSPHRLLPISSNSAMPTARISIRTKYRRTG